MKGEVSNRGKVEREKGSQIMTSKKHKRFDSLVSDQYAKKDIPDYTNAFDKLVEEEKKTNKKKKCKTQGEESI